jgi:hypothetical protein
MEEMVATGRWERMTADRNWWVKVALEENWDPRPRQGHEQEVAMLALKRVTENAETVNRKRESTL